MIQRLLLSTVALFCFTSCHQKESPALAKVDPVHITKKRNAYAPLWRELTSYTDTTGRNDDLCFLTPDLGWTINNHGRLYQTRDGGVTWDVQFEKAHSFFRCLVFADSLHGWLGTIGQDEAQLESKDPVVLYETKNGGEDWQPTTIEGEYPKGLCGLQQVTTDMIVGCGRVRGPSHFIKTNDRGKTWQSFNLDSIAGALIAPYFFDAQNGLLIGGTASHRDDSRALILKTKDGGLTWKKLFESSQLGEYCWKIHFPTPLIGYISIQRNVTHGKFHFLKTEDGGATWKEQEYAKKYYFTQGIGFMNDSVGWIGGSKLYGTYETVDAGATWKSVPAFGEKINKFQFFGDSIGYAAGRKLYKFEWLK